MRMYDLERRSILSLKQLRDLVAVNPDLTAEEKEANIKAIDAKLYPTSKLEKAKADILDGMADTDDVF